MEIKTPKSPVLLYSQKHLLRLKLNSSPLQFKQIVSLTKVPKDASTQTRPPKNMREGCSCRKIADPIIPPRTAPFKEPSNSISRNSTTSSMTLEEWRKLESGDDSIKVPLSFFLGSRTSDTLESDPMSRLVNLKVENSIDKCPAEKENDPIRNSKLVQLFEAPRRQPLAEKRDALHQNNLLPTILEPISMNKPNHKCVQTDHTVKGKFVDVFTQTFEQNELMVNGRSLKLLSKIGQGGTSEVFQVFDPLDSMVKALKVVKLSKSDSTIEDGYRNEITLLQRLQHLNKVVKFHDFEFQDGRLLILLEKGDTDLSQVLNSHRKAGSLNPLAIKFFWSEMLEAVQQIHNEGIIHLDLKPANFILVRGNLKLIDFGIATAVQQDMTSVLKFDQIGTLNYMAPETLQGCHVGQSIPQFKVRTRSDVWSLGCILHNLVYGHPPFHRFASQIARFNAILNPHLLQFPDVDDELLLDVLKSCLIADPLKRPSINELRVHSYLNSC